MNSHLLEQSLIQLQKLNMHREPMAITYDSAAMGFQVFMDLQDPLILHREHCHQELEALFAASPQRGQDSALSWQGQVGFMGYEFLAANMGIQCRAPRDLSIVDGVFARPQTLVRIKATEVEIESTRSERKHSLHRLFQAADKPLPPASQQRKRNISCNLEFDDYAARFEQAMQAIHRGETYQIKLSQRYQTATTEQPLDLFIQLMRINPSPESFLFQWHDFSLVSCSPETLLTRKGKRLITRPIGGTCQRESDSQGLNAFLENPKEAAEHNMLVDLLRNDLSRVCQRGSVVIDRYRDLETYSHLHHLVTTISGIQKDEATASHIISSIFPGGSIVGCPKYKTMELIDALEPSFRGPYTGSFGLIEDSGDFHFNIIIRSLLKLKAHSYIQTASGIVADSNARDEYDENQLKAQALLQLFS